MKTDTPKLPKHYSLVGKTAIITGAAGLLGIAHSRALLSIGASVVLTDINIEQLKKVKSDLSREFGACGIHLYVMDVTSEQSVDSVYKSLGLENPEPDRFYHITLANNEGGNPFKSIGNVTKKDFEK